MKTLVHILAIFLFMGNAYAQQKTISGIVSDENGQPLPGATVLVKGTTTGTQTDFDGKYSIHAKVGDTLTFAYVGYASQEVKIKSAVTINVSLQPSAELEEVVVTAYSEVTRRSNVTHIPSRVSAESIKKRETKARHDKIAGVLQGKADGVQINGANGNIRIRGYSSIKTDKQPLYIVDGMPIRSVNNGLIEKIDPKDIDKLTVYKGNKATALFGSSARNGCIVITTKAGNYRVENDEAYAQINENKFERVSLSPLSTFSIDVDKASYSNVRRMLNNGQKVPFNAVKIEEMVNYFDYEYPQPTDEHPFSINTEVAQTPWNKDTKLVRIGLQGKVYENDEIPASNLVFLLDVSGSMGSPNKLPLLKSAFKLLVSQLREKDKVSIVVYAGAAGVVLEPTSGDQKERILDALDNLEAGGSTAGGAGIQLAYKLAQKHFSKKGNNRVILATDGDFNVGASSDKDMEKLIEEKRESGVFLSVLGFGYGNYKDSKLETLADKGNGNHSYIDNMQEAQKVFGKEFGGTLYTIAKDVKIQVEFNPSKVQAYRLIGYENRLLEDEDFIDDTKDAGELGAGHTVTALYEVIPVGVKSEYLREVDGLKYTKQESKEAYSKELLTVKFRYKKPDGDKSIEMQQVVQDVVSKTMSSDFKFASSVALFGMQLRKSQFYNKVGVQEVIGLANAGRGTDKDGYRAEFIRLVKSTL